MEISNRKITTETVLKQLEKEGKTVTLEDAEMIVSYIYLLAEIFVNELQGQ
ncbi:hypothetical protein BDD43_0101 [Mucilaginibacter gracilis]|uniref:Uncharacterized protein n=1 Tax=Mucilaginibacter gracilis TaxID=423350 RepID=A0A495IU04_9SPHI|nr:hypothetical protein [Mucilaginibacter gracilis]RKR80013.1 hypothetical protein BDD43_0101 [Mucilaginibacter gracilis]